ncbi:MAG TPA: glycosyltransferase family 4 protein [Mucilaginibacter sp.]|jgi:glycosyltransferase involved in cell wall biosynthesis|nr:glycosyltransferase family 4 protein [Mucilaginibacter sp.]
MDKKAKVLFILHLPPPVHGASMMGQLIRDSNLINDAFDADYINLSISKNLNEIEKYGIQKFFRLLKLQGNVFGRLMRKRYDVCYITLTVSGPSFYKDLLIVMVLKLFRRKIVYHFHNKGVEEASRMGINRMLYRFTFRNSKSILLSHYLYPDIKRYVDEKDVYYCANGIPVNPFKDGQVPVQNGTEVCKLLFFSNMMMQKGVYVLLDACKLLRDKGVKFECHFVGAWSDISEKEFKVEVERNGLQEYVFAHGGKYGTEKGEFFYNSDVFIFPTYYHNETFGLVNLEAMQFSLPVISTTEGGISEVVSDGITGFLVPQRNITALARKIETLVNDTALRHKMGEEGKKKYYSYFTIEKFEERLTNILKDASGIKS